MTVRTWVRNLFARTPRTRRQEPPRFRPRLEALEDRLAPATITVTNTADALHYNPSATITDLTNHTNLISGNTDTTITLRDALNAAANSGIHDICTIKLQAGTTYTLNAVDNNWYGPDGLPAISSNVTIDGNGATLLRDPAAPIFRFFYVSGGLELPAGRLTLEGLTLTGHFQMTDAKAAAKFKSFLEGVKIESAQQKVAAPPADEKDQWVIWQVRGDVAAIRELLNQQKK